MAELNDEAIVQKASDVITPKKTSLLIPDLGPMGEAPQVGFNETLGAGKGALIAAVASGSSAPSSTAATRSPYSAIRMPREQDMAK
jgi:hypothetical protein